MERWHVEMTITENSEFHDEAIMAVIKRAIEGASLGMANGATRMYIGRMVVDAISIEPQSVADEIAYAHK